VPSPAHVAVSSPSKALRQRIQNLQILSQDQDWPYLCRAGRGSIALQSQAGRCSGRKQWLQRSWSQPSTDVCCPADRRGRCTVLRTPPGSEGVATSVAEALSEAGHAPRLCAASDVLPMLPQHACDSYYPPAAPCPFLRSCVGFITPARNAILRPGFGSCMWVGRCILRGEFGEESGTF
jgi:hypothetical protein